MDSVTNVSSKTQIPKQTPAQDDDFGYGDDRISELPDDVLLRILSYLPTKDIIATCALSSRWEFLWKSFDLLIHDFDFEVDYQVPRREVVDWDTVQRQIEQIPDRARIRKFRLKWIKNRWRSAITKKRTEWNSLLSKLVRHKVEVLDLCIHPQWRRLRSLPWPDSLYASDSLTTLKLDMSLQLHLPASICFPRLKTLHLKRIRFHQENNPEQLFSACPKLEELFFRWCALISNHYPQKLSISIASLRRLIFHHDTYIVLSINCSILQSLEFLCYKFKLSECNLPSLAEADLHNWDHIHHGLELFERIRHVKSLRLSAQTIEAFPLSKNFNVDSLPTFYNMTHLEVSDITVWKEASLMHILPKSPNLRCLHFSIPKGLIFEYFKMDDSLTLEEVVSFYFNRSLKSLTISKFYGSELEVNVHFHIPDFDSIWRSIKADVRFVGKILENVDVLEKFKMELVNMKVYIMESVHKGQAKQFLLRRL